MWRFASCMFSAILRRRPTTLIVSSARGAAPRRGDAAAVVEEVGVEVGVADAVARGLHLAEVDAEVAGARRDGGGGEDFRARAASVSGSCLAGSGRGPAASALRGFGSSAVAVGGISSACAGGRLRPLPSASGCSSSVSAGGSSAGAAAPSVSISTSTEPIAIWSPTSPASFEHRARDRRFHLDRRLVGHHVGELLVFLDRVADLDVPGDDLGLGNAFADVGQLELVRLPSVRPSLSRARS